MSNSLLTLPIAADGAIARPLFPVRPAGLAAVLGELSAAQAAYVRGMDFQARAQELVLVPGDSGVVAALLGLGEDRSHLAFGDLAFRLPKGDWAVQQGDYDPSRAMLGHCLGSYRFARFRSPKRPAARLVIAGGTASVADQAVSINIARDLVNMPANLLGPSELADAAQSIAAEFGAEFSRVSGDKLAAEYPTIFAVGRGSPRAPVVASFTWKGSQAAENAPHISLCGKGVVFDTGGLDLKPAAGMLRMKKDMGGAASILALARIVMAADLAVRLSVRIGCVENAVSGEAMRPSDVITTRRGLAVEIGNTDAEGRLVLCDLLAEASDEQPDLLIDCATLTGAARVALGPDLPVLFCNDPRWAAAFIAAGEDEADPMWQLPLWDGYDSWLDSPVADLNNVSSKPLAGAIVAALYLRRFISPRVAWAHLDSYAWNDATRPARPEGGEVMGMRAMASAIIRRFGLQNQIAEGVAA